MSHNFTDEQQYILQLLEWGKNQLSRGNLTALPDFNNLNLSENIKQEIITFSKANSIYAGKKKHTINISSKAIKKKSNKKSTKKSIKK